MSKNKKKRIRKEIKQLRELRKGHSMDSIGQSPSGGWSNPYNNYGLETDPTFNTAFLPPLEFTFRELTDLYQNPLIKRGINLYAGDGTRKGFELTSKDNNDLARDIKQEMDERFNWLALGAKMIAIWKLYGGGVLFADVEDGRDPRDPINENSVRKVWSFQPVERFLARPLPTSANTFFGVERPGQPLHYQITLQGFGGATTFTCHESRLIRFPSFESDDVISQNERVKRVTWSMPPTQVIYDTIKRYGIGMQSMSQLLQGFVEDVFKVSKLKDYKDPEALRTYVREQRLNRNSMRATIMGADDSLEKIVTPTQGLGEINQDIRRDVGMAWEIPVPIFFSEESGGLGGSTLSESRKVWNDHTESRQGNMYTPMYRRMAYLVSLETGWDLTDIQYAWNPLETMSPGEQAELELKVAEKDKIYIESAGAKEADILNKRWGGGKFSSEVPDFDKDEFEKELEEDENAELKQKELEMKMAANEKQQQPNLQN